MRNLFAAILLVVMCTLVTGFFLTKKRVPGSTVQFNSKDLSNNGLILIEPTDDSYDKELAITLKRKDTTIREMAESIRPFSVILVNKGKKEVIAYAIKWEAVDAAGNTISRVDSYVQPGVLMGITPSGDEKINEIGIAIRAHQSRLLFWGGMDNDLGMLSKEEMVNPELAHAISITASLDSVVFDDGTAVGPDSTKFFSQVESEVQAKKDLLQIIHSKYFKGTSMKEILDTVGMVAAEPEETPSVNSPGSYYRYHRRLFANEISSIRKFEKDDKKTIMRVLQPLKNKWKAPKKVEQSH